MTRFILITGGKGGCGKTTTSINLGAALNFYGKDVTVIDANFTTPNVGLHLGYPVTKVNLHQALQGKKHISEAIHRHYSGIKFVPGGISLADLKRTNPVNLKKVLYGLSGTTEFVIVDSAAGLGREALIAMDAVHEVLIVTNPEMPALTDALKTIKLAESMGKKVLGVVVTRSYEDDLSVSSKNVETILEKPILAIVPEDRAVRKSLTMKNTVVYTHPSSRPALSYKKLASKILGKKFEEEQEERPTKERKSILTSILRGLGF